jgi:hypothetical protein
MAISKKERKFWDWFVKVNEKCTIILKNISIGADITEEDELLIKEFYAVYVNGNYPLFTYKETKKPPILTQQNIKYNDTLAFNDVNLRLERTLHKSI